MFPAVGQDVEDDGFEVRESGGEDDLDWQPHPIEQENGSSSGDDEQDNSDISDLMDLSDAGFKHGSRKEGIVREDPTSMPLPPWTTPTD